MNQETQDAWNKWARNIASKVARDHVLLAVDQILPATKTALEKRDARIAELERRIADLEKAATDEKTGKRPLRSVA